MDCSLPGFSVHGISQARILEWVASFSRVSSQPRDQTRVSHIAGKFFTIWVTRETLKVSSVAYWWLVVLIYFSREFVFGRKSKGWISSWCTIWPIDRLSRRTGWKWPSVEGRALPHVSWQMTMEIAKFKCCRAHAGYTSAFQECISTHI